MEKSMSKEFMEAVGQHHHTIVLEKSVFSEDFNCIPLREVVIECITHHPFEVAEGFSVYERCLDRDSGEWKNILVSYKLTSDDSSDIKIAHKFYESFTNAMTDYKERKICLRQTLCVLSVGKKTYPTTDKKK